MERGTCGLSAEADKRDCLVGQRASEVTQTHTRGPTDHDALV